MNDIPIGPEQPDRPILANGDSQPEPTLNLNPWCRCGLGPDREGLTHCLYRAADGGDFCLECHHAGVNESPMPCSCDCEFCDPDGDSDIDLLANQSQEPNADLQQGTGLAQFFPLEVIVEPPPAADIISVSSSTMSEGHPDQGLIASLCPMSVDDITIEDPPISDGNHESSLAGSSRDIFYNGRPLPRCSCTGLLAREGESCIRLVAPGSDFCDSCAIDRCECSCGPCDPSSSGSYTSSCMQLETYMSRQPTPPRPMCQCDPFGTGTGCWLIALRNYGYVNSDYCHSCAGSECTCECPHCDPSGARRVDNPEIIGDVDSGVTSETRVPVEGQDDLGLFDDGPSGSENT